VTRPQQSGRCSNHAQINELTTQAEILWFSDRQQLDPWHLTGKVFQSMDHQLSTIRWAAIRPV
jgi:hypothetical protein